MRAIRSLRFLVVSVALVFLLAGSASAATYSFGGRFTSNRGRSAQVPLFGLAGEPATGTAMGLAGCRGLQLMTGAGPAGTVTPMLTMAQGINNRGAKDLGCMPNAPRLGAMTPGVMVTTTGKGVGGAFTLPVKAFVNMGPPTTINAVGITTLPGILQFATSNTVHGPRSPRLEAPMGTMNNGTNTASFRKFKTGAWATQTGRAAAKFTWCPPATVSGAGGPCTKIGQGGFPEIIKYNGTATSFGGTMNYITKQVNPGSLIQANGALGIVVPFGTVGQNGMEATLATGRGYADHHVDVLLKADVRASHMEATVPRPIVGPQKLVTMLGVHLASGPAGIAHGWGFPATTRTVLVRNTGTLGGGPHNTTFSARGYDCVGAVGAGCAKATGMGFRNISLVAGALGVGVLPPPTGNVPTIAFVTTWMPEPGRALQLLSGMIALLGIAAWRSRRVR